MSLRWTGAMVLVAVISAGLGGCGNSEPKMACTSSRINDDVYTEWDGKQDTMYFHVTTQSGIGGLRITREDKQWPERMVLRLSVPSLDSVTITNDTMKITARFDQGKPTVHQVVGTEHCHLSHEECQFEVASIANGAFTDVTIPREVCDPNCRSLEVGWVRSAMRAAGPVHQTQLGRIADGLGEDGDIHYADRPRRPDEDVARTD